MSRMKAAFAVRSASMGISIGQFRCPKASIRNKSAPSSPMGFWKLLSRFNKRRGGGVRFRLKVAPANTRAANRRKKPRPRTAALKPLEGAHRKREKQHTRPQPTVERSAQITRRSAFKKRRSSGLSAESFVHHFVACLLSPLLRRGGWDLTNE